MPNRSNAQRFEVEECDIARVVCPAEIHARRQRLLRRFTIKGRIDPTIPPPQLAIRIRGLVDELWPVQWSENTGVNRLTAIEPANPPIRIPADTLDATAEQPSVFEAFLDGHRVWSQDIVLLPPCAVPTALESATVLAGLVIPSTSDVIALLQAAKDRIPSQTRHLGFPNLTPGDLATLVCSEINHHFLHVYALEPGPWKRNVERQVIRLPQRIATEREATCVDLALLVCSILERIRRLGLIVGMKDSVGNWHIISGLRKNDDDIGTLPLDLNRRSVLTSCRVDRTLLIDPTDAFASKDPAFSDASARRRLEEAAEVFLVDIQAARECDIWPLPIAERINRPLPASSWSAPRRIIEYPSGIPPNLVDDLSKGQLAVIVGDVLSSPTDHGRRELIRHISREAGLRTEDLLEAATLIENRRGRKFLNELSLDFLNARKGQDIPSIYRVLSRLSIDTVVSFYPDPLLELALTEVEHPFKVLIDDGDLAKFELAPSSRQLYLLGGSAVSGRGLSLTRADHQILLRRVKYLARGLRERISFATLLLVNCDLLDTTLKMLYVRATAHRSAHIHKIYLSGCEGAERWLEPAQVLNLTPEELLHALSGVPSTRSELAPSPVAQRSYSARTPYKFLDYFEAEDRHMFFGRDEAATDFTAEIRAAPGRIAVLCGRSGVGKTSLVKAGLIWRLEHSANVIYARSTSDPEEAVRLAFTRELDEPIEDSTPITTLCKRLVAQSGKEQIVFVDQFEEALIKLTPALIRSIFRWIVEIVTDSALATRFVLVVREDFLGRVAEHIASAPDLLASPYCLEELSRSAAKDAILLPPRAIGVEISDDLADEILDDLSADSIMPAHLQIICEHLYQHRSVPTKMTIEDYDGLGRARKILADHLELAIQALPDGVERRTRAVLSTLVTSEKTKDLLTMSQIAARSQISESDALPIVHDLIHIHRLVREVPGDPLRFELSHEILAASVSSWLDATGARIRAVQEIIDQEYLTFTKLGAKYRIPSDRLHLIDEFRQDLTLTGGILQYIVSELAIEGILSDFWTERLKQLPSADQVEALVFRPAAVSLEALAEVLRSSLNAFLDSAEPISFPRSCAEAITRLALSGESGLAQTAVRLSLLDSERAAEAKLLIEVHRLPDAHLRMLSTAYRQRLVTEPHNDLLSIVAIGRIESFIVYAMHSRAPERLVHHLAAAADARTVVDVCLVVLSAMATAISLPKSLTPILRSLPARGAKVHEFNRWSVIYEIEASPDAYRQVEDVLATSWMGLVSADGLFDRTLLSLGTQRALARWLSDATGLSVTDCEAVAHTWLKNGNASAASRLPEIYRTGPEGLIFVAAELIGPSAIVALLSAKQSDWLLGRVLSTLVASDWVDHVSDESRVVLRSSLAALSPRSSPVLDILAAGAEIRLASEDAAITSLISRMSGDIVRLEGVAILEDSLQIALVMAFEHCLRRISRPENFTDAILRISGLLASWHKSLEPGIQYQLGRSLPFTGDAEAIRAGLSAQFPPIRSGCLDALREMRRSGRLSPERLSQGLLRKQLQDSDSMVRLSAAKVLLDLNDRDSVEVVRLLLRKTNIAGSLRSECIRSLADVEPTFLTKVVAPLFWRTKTSRRDLLDVLDAVEYKDLVMNVAFISELLGLFDPHSHDGRAVSQLLMKWAPQVVNTLEALAADPAARIRKAAAVNLRKLRASRRSGNE